MNARGVLAILVGVTLLALFQFGQFFDRNATFDVQHGAAPTAAADARAPGTGLVPPHLRDAHYKGAAGLGHGEGYDYPHDDPRGWVEQAHRPEEVEGHVYYEPSPHGFEAEVARRIAELSDPEESP